MNKGKNGIPVAGGHIDGDPNLIVGAEQFNQGPVDAINFVVLDKLHDSVEPVRHILIHAQPSLSSVPIKPSTRRFRNKALSRQGQRGARDYNTDGLRMSGGYLSTTHTLLMVLSRSRFARE
jgi:hypothetical protein